MLIRMQHHSDNMERHNSIPTRSATTSSSWTLGGDLSWVFPSRARLQDLLGL